jgi:hypothetical protein
MGSFGSTKTKVKSAAQKAADAAKKGAKRAGDAAKTAGGKVKKAFTKSGFYNYASDEPAWMKRISNSNISNWFYFFFVVNAILFVLSLIFVLTHLTGRGAKPLSMSAPVLLAGAFSAVNTLFFYLLAERALD